MVADARSNDPLAAQIAAIREFNRFYTTRLGLLRKRHLDGAFSLTEARTLFEIGAHRGTTARVLRETLELDAGYLSRILAALTRRKLIRQTASKMDGREKQLTLTSTGDKAVARLNEQSTQQLREMLAHVGEDDRRVLVDSIARIRQILGKAFKPIPRIERLVKVRREALAILEEYYEAVQVVLRDSPVKLRKLLQEPGAGMWLASLEDEVVGCVLLRALSDIPGAAECKRLYVKPSARGNRIADKLLDAMEEFAREQGFRWIYLDTYDDLKAAIAVYERRGYKRCKRYNDNPQATLFLRKRIA